MQLSVVIVNHNTRDLLAVCLTSLGMHLAGVEHEVFVVDNASTDGSPDMIRRGFPHVRLLQNATNLGFAAAVNLALRSTNGQCICWLNSDAQLLDDRLAGLLQYFDAHADVGVIGPQIVNGDGSIQLSCRSFPSYATALFNRNSLLTRWFPRNAFSRTYLLANWDHASVREVDWVSGACLFHRRSVSDQLHGLDERFFMYMEDIDFSLRARQAGWKVVYHPLLRVRHSIGGSSRRIPFRSLVALHRSIWLYYLKHFRRNLVLDSAGAAVIGARFVVRMLATAITLGRGER